MTQTVLTQPAQVTGIVQPTMPLIQLEELHLRNAEIALKDQAQTQNRISFAERDAQQTWPTMPTDVAQLVTALTRQQAPTPPLMQQTTPLQQVLPPTTQQQQDTLPPQPTGEPPRAEGMEMDVLEMEVGQSDEKMDDRTRAHKSGSKEPTEDAEQT